MANIILSKREIEEFWSKVDIGKSDECWEWTGDLFSGYGHFRIDSQGRKAHRVAWTITNGPIPKRKPILHKCDNRKCVNPSHLYLGTYSDNMCDMYEKGRNSPAVGGQPKLYEGEIWLIRRLRIVKSRNIHVRYKFPATLVSKMFKVSPELIHSIWNSDRWLSREGTYV